MKKINVLQQCEIKTPLGMMVALGNDQAVSFLAFEESDHFLDTLRSFMFKQSQYGHTDVNQQPGAALLSLHHEITAYFAGTLQIFKTPIALHGTDFQKMSWRALCDVPYGETISYAKQAENMGRPAACRAVASANAANYLSIIVPCHRIIQKNGKIGGYAGGVNRKEWLLNHEKNRCLDVVK